MLIFIRTIIFIRLNFLAPKYNPVESMKLISGIVLENQMSLVKNPSTGKVLALFGIFEFLTSPQDPQNDFCAFTGTLQPCASTLVTILTCRYRGFSRHLW